MKIQSGQELETCGQFDSKNQKFAGSGEKNSHDRDDLTTIKEEADTIRNIEKDTYVGSKGEKPDSGLLTEREDRLVRGRVLSVDVENRLSSRDPSREPKTERKGYHVPETNTRKASPAHERLERALSTLSNELHKKYDHEIQKVKSEKRKIELANFGYLKTEKKPSRQQLESPLQKNLAENQDNQPTASKQVSQGWPDI